MVVKRVSVELESIMPVCSIYTAPVKADGQLVRLARHYEECRQQTFIYSCDSDLAVLGAERVLWEFTTNNAGRAAAGLAYDRGLL